MTTGNATCDHVEARDESIDDVRRHFNLSSTASIVDFVINLDNELTEVKRQRQYARDVLSRVAVMAGVDDIDDIETICDTIKSAMIRCALLESEAGNLEEIVDDDKIHESAPVDNIPAKIGR